MQGIRDGVDIEVLVRKGQIWTAYQPVVQGIHYECIRNLC
jgi:hypothetical protein